MTLKMVSVNKCTLFLMLLICNTGYAQKMGRLEEVGSIPLQIQAEGFLFEKLGRQGYPDRPGWFVEPVGKHRENKVQSVVFGGRRLTLSLLNNPPQLKWPADFYYRIVDRHENDVSSSVRPSTSAKDRDYDYDNPSATMLDTSLKVSDYLFADFYDTKTDTLIKSYYLKRLRMYPELIKGHPEITTKPDTTITFEFDNREKLPDNVLEYRLVSRGDTSLWKQTGFILRFDYLRSAELYNLQVRYIFQPESIKNLPFNIGPEWYQQSWFRWLESLLIILAFVLINRQSKNVDRKRQEELQQKLRVVQSQLNPHFIFNSLSSIQALMNTGRITEANEYLSEFSKLMRTTLNGSDRIYNQLDLEIAVLETYLKLEKLRFGFQYTITVATDLNPSEVEVPVLLFQPMVENAVKHGVSGLNEAGKVDITFYKENKDFICKIEDNGKGYTPDHQEFGYGFRLTRDRIKLINEMNKQNTVDLNIQSTVGTSIKIIFKNWL